MPELPEVETIRRDLARALTGRTIRGLTVRKVKLLRGASARQFHQRVVSARILDVSRRAKQLVLALSSGYTLLVHLKMTGQLVLAAPGANLKVGGHPIAGVRGVPNKYTYITLTLSGGRQLYFNDVRQFGYWRLVPTSGLPQVLAKLGPEPLAKEFTLARFRASLARRGRTSIKAALLDQSVVAGIGNIYADESLFVARLRPSRRVKSLHAAELAGLWRAVRAVLRRAVAARGTSFNSYVDGLGRAGTYWDKRLVYGRAGEPCPRCRRPIVRTVVAGRGTHTCPHCQR